jgi:hypothetical protein
MLLGAVAALALGCTTYVKPTTCTEGSTECGGVHDARFCEYVARAVQGAGCTSLGVIQERPFCVVTTSCVDTSYVVKTGDCRILQYQKVRDDDRDECAPSTPMFVSR